METRRSTVIMTALLFLLLSSCRPYYIRQQTFLRLVAEERYAEAEAELSSSRRAKKKERHRLLYLLNRGYVAFQQGSYAESTQWFMKADRMVEEYRKQLGYEALSILVNPGVKPYKAEDFEVVMMHYFTTLSFLKQRNFESALVECRRMNLSLQDMHFADSKKPRYKNDAFGHLLMGLSYEASGDVNNAFIAYRNAVEVYRSDYNSYFGLGVPEQLKHDLVRTAMLNGFQDEAKRWSDTLGVLIPEKNKARPDAELVILWQNGLGPVKEQWSIDFTIVQQGGQLFFNNAGMGLSFAFPTSSVSSNDLNNLQALRVFRVAFPRYVSRLPAFNRATVSQGGFQAKVEMVQPIDQIAFKSLEDRFAREMGNAILRFAVKKATEYAIRKENKDAGALMGIANAITEQADTRNWQTLPYSIGYARVPLSAGENKVVFKAESSGRRAPFADTLCIEAQKGRTYFEVISTIRP